MVLEIQCDDDGIRHDINSTEMKRECPLLPIPTDSDWNDHVMHVARRIRYIEAKDTQAYENLKRLHDIDFKPRSLINITWYERWFLFLEALLKKMPQSLDPN